MIYPPESPRVQGT